MRRIGIDPGSARTGLAIADDEVPVAMPLQTIAHRSLDEALQQVAAVVVAERVSEVVVGLPLALDGREGEAARKARLFAQRLEAMTKARVILWDERLSTVAATRALAEARGAGSQGRGRSRGPRSGGRDKGRVDRAAATLILQGYLDSQRAEPWPNEATHPDEPPPDGPEFG